MTHTARHRAPDGRAAAAVATAPGGPGTGLAAAGLHVRFGALEAVRDVSLQVRAGELIAVTGPSGAGKTSLLGALAGVYTPAAGQVSLDGTAVRDRDDATERDIVLIPQGNALVSVLTALENAAIPLLNRRVPDAEELATTALTAVGLGEALGQLVEELSGGQQQRLAVARGLAQRGAVVLADEPTSELDSVNRGVVMRLLRAEADRGAVVVVATHDPDAAEVCDAELRLDEGLGSWVRDHRGRAGS